MRILNLFMLLFLITTFLSCERIPGCTDSRADNFDPNATRDDGTCNLDASLIFWFDLQTSSQLLAAGVSQLNYFIDNAQVGTSSPVTYEEFAPDCNTVGLVTVERFLTGVAEQPVAYVIQDQSGIVYWEGTVSFVGGECTAFQLTL